MPKWMWYIVAAAVAYVLWKKLNVSGAATVSTGGGVPTGYTGWGNQLPPGVPPGSAYGGYGGAPVTVGSPSGTSVAQDVATYAGAATGLIGAFTNLFGGSSSSSGGSDSGGSYGDATYGNDPVVW
jgi:hypothetical protein